MLKTGMDFLLVVVIVSRFTQHPNATLYDVRRASFLGGRSKQKKKINPHFDRSTGINLIFAVCRFSSLRLLHGTHCSQALLVIVEDLFCLREGFFWFVAVEEGVALLKAERMDHCDEAWTVLVVMEKGMGRGGTVS